MEEPHFIECQHHLLDRMLCVLIDEELGRKASPNIKYPFISKLNNYKEFKEHFKKDEKKVTETAGWRDDKKYYHLLRVFRFSEESGIFPKMKFEKYLYSYVMQDGLTNHSFNEQIYNIDDYQNLCSSLQAHENGVNSVNKF